MTSTAAKQQTESQLSIPMSADHATEPEVDIEQSEHGAAQNTANTDVATNAESKVIDDIDYQNQILPGVSRTFALTIPQLPGSLHDIVANAYLLCRIADTIEDDAGIGIDDKKELHDLFLAALRGEVSSDTFIERVHPLISDNALPEERELIKNTDRVLRITHSFSARQQDILQRRIGTMCAGMPVFQHALKRQGLDSLDVLDEYCYYVAGVVGEMLTELFCDHSDDIAARGGQMMQLAASFGQGLQMTNILKDIWEDFENETCWLPRDVFSAVGYDLAALSQHENSATFAKGIDHLVSIAHAHLRNALEYTLLIPRHESGLRRFCLWSIGLALLTLRRIHQNPNFSNSAQIKVSRKTVRATVLITSTCGYSNSAIRLLFKVAARDLPRAYGFPKFASNRLNSEL